MLTSECSFSFKTLRQVVSIIKDILISGSNSDPKTQRWIAGQQCLLNGEKEEKTDESTVARLTALVGQCVQKAIKRRGRLSTLTALPVWLWTFVLEEEHATLCTRRVERLVFFPHVKVFHNLVAKLFFGVRIPSLEKKKEEAWFVLTWMNMKEDISLLYHSCLME